MYAILTSGVPTLLPDGDIVAGDVTHPRQILSLWSAAELRAIGVYAIQETPIPEGKVSTGWTLQKSGQTVSRVHTLADAPPYVAPVPDEISDRQFAQQLAILGVITEQQAEDWAARGDLPPAMLTAVGALPDDGTRFAARMLLRAATTYNRSHPMVATLGVMLGYTSGQLDDLWRAAAAL